MTDSIADAWRPLASSATLIARSRLLQTTRAFFTELGVIEVQTPVLGRATVTDPEVEAVAVDEHGYLQTSPEYFMKRLLADGVPDCFQLGPVFRSGEQGRLHNVEFTMLEWYRLHITDRELMREVERYVDQILGAANYRYISFDDLLKDVSVPADELDLALADAMAALSGRVFIVDYPVDQAVLAQVRTQRAVNDGEASADTTGSQYAARFELVIDGVEIANGYWELTDAAEHRRRFATDNKFRLQAGKELVSEDADFLAAIDAGLPPCAGVALGFDRLVMLALNKKTISDVLYF